MLRAPKQVSLFVVLITFSRLINAQVSDPLSSLLWHIGFPGYPNQQDYPGHINLSNVHDSYTGSGVVVVVSDDGLEMEHPDLSANVSTNLSRDYFLPSPYIGDPSPTDSSQYHGTLVAGYIGAAKNNGEGGFGVAPESTLVGFKYLGSAYSLTKKISQANLSTAHIFNYSYGPDNSYIAPTQIQYLDTLKNFSFRRNQNYVVAAGNEYLVFGLGNGFYLGNANFSQDYATPYTIVVGALNSNASSAAYSTPGSNLWISAPGGDLSDGGLGVLSTDVTGCVNGLANSSSEDEFDNGSNELNEDCNYAMNIQGTSFASPIIAGVIALMRDANPALTWRDVKHILASTAKKNHPGSINHTHPLQDDLPGFVFEPGWRTNAAGYPFHNWYGFGQVDAEEAVALSLVKNFDLGQWFSTELPDRSSFYKTGTLNLNVPDNSATGVSHSISVNRHRMVIEHVRVRINVSHTYPSDLGIELTSPSGTKSILKYYNDNMEGTNLVATFGSNAFYGERSEGLWRVKLVDGAQYDYGKLLGWQLYLDGSNRGPRTNLGTPKPPTKAVIATGNRITITQAAQSNLLRHEACIYVSGVCNEVDWFPLSSLSFTLSHYSKDGIFASASAIKKGAYFNLAVRAINTSEKRSSVKVFRLQKK